MVYYRKYRPQLIDDLDNTAVRTTLSSVLKNSSTHAFLFTGPKGLGKTSTARIIAKVVNCENRAEGDIEPCNKCEQCISITNGTNLDVLEIDAASNRGIDEIRDLKEKIRLAPASSAKKVYIIDEVHMLTTEAFNALLKTLEEPPSHAMFILCTTEPHKVPATIISRCFHIHFSLATEEEIVRSLKRVAAGEKLVIDDDALFAIAKMADGGFRDATKILEEVVALAEGKKITKETIKVVYKTTNISLDLAELLGALKKGDAKAGLTVVTKLLAEGIDIKFFVTQILSDLHTKLLKKMGVEKALENESSDNVQFEIDEIRVLVDLFSKVYLDMKTSVLPQLPLELAVIEYCQFFDNVIARSETMKQSQSNEVITKKEEGVTVSSLRKQVGTMKKIQALYGAPKVAAASDEPEIKTSTVELMHSSPNGEITQEWLEHFWRNLIQEIKNYNHTIAGVLRGCSIKQYDKKVLIIETVYKFHKERLNEGKTLDALAKACKLLTGKVIEVKVELKA